MKKLSQEEIEEAVRKGQEADAVSMTRLVAVMAALRRKNIRSVMLNRPGDTPCVCSEKSGDLNVVSPPDRLDTFDIWSGSHDYIQSDVDLATAVEVLSGASGVKQ